MPHIMIKAWGTVLRRRIEYAWQEGEYFVDSHHFELIMFSRAEPLSQNFNVQGITEVLLPYHFELGRQIHESDILISFLIKINRINLTHLETAAPYTESLDGEDTAYYQVRDQRTEEDIIKGLKL